MGIELQDKINLINNRIENMNIHISVLENDIINNPDSDVEGKINRSQILEEFKSIKNSLILELDLLTNQI